MAEMLFPLFLYHKNTETRTEKLSAAINRVGEYYSWGQLKTISKESRRSHEGVPKDCKMRKLFFKREKV